VECCTINDGCGLAVRPVAAGCCQHPISAVDSSRGSSAPGTGVGVQCSITRCAAAAVRDRGNPAILLPGAGMLFVDMCGMLASSEMTVNAPG
jgi:hypothetical protein